MVEEVLCYLNVGELDFLGMNNEQTQTYNYNGVLSTSLVSLTLTQNTSLLFTPIQLFFV